MKRLLIILLLCCLPFAAVAEKDRAALTEGMDCTVYLDVNQIDTVIRPMQEPFFGTVDGEGEMIAFLDYVEIPDLNGTFMRLTLSLVTDEPVNAEELVIAFGKNSYTFDVWPQTSEYDTVYYEDYAVTFDDKTIAMLKALCKNKAEVTYTLTGDSVRTGSLTIDADVVRTLYDRFMKVD